MSKWLTPDKYYVSFPHGVYFPTEIRKYRNDISSNSPFYLAYNGTTIKQGGLLGFTFTYDDYHNIKDYMKNRCYQLNKPIKVFTFEESYSYLPNEDEVVKELETYYKIDSWQDYCEFLAESGQRFKKPSKLILNYHEWNGIGIDE